MQEVTLIIRPEMRDSNHRYGIGPTEEQKDEIDYILQIVKDELWKHGSRSRKIILDIE